MANAAQQMPEHVEAAYKAAVDNIIFLKRQFGVLKLLLVIHWCMLHLFQRAIEKFRNRLSWIYKTYFSADERAGLDVQMEPRSYWYPPELYIGLIAVSFVGAVLTAVYLWSVR